MHTTDQSQHNATDVVRVLLVDDNDVFRGGVQIALQGDSTIEVVGDATRGDIAIRQALELQPDVILMDIQMPIMNGIEATVDIMKRRPTTKIIMLTSMDEKDQAMKALQGGAVGFLYKDAISGEYLRNGIHTVMQGGSIMHPDILKKINAEAVTKPAERSMKVETSELDIPLSILSKSELELLTLVAHGAENKQIAVDLGVSAKTVTNRLSMLYTKINVTNRVGATKYALKAGVVSL